MTINISGAMVATVYDILMHVADTEPSLLDVEHSQGDYTVNGNDALDLFCDLVNMTERLEGSVE